MRKIIDFFKWPLAFPLITIAGIYIYWILSAPMDLFGGLEDIGNYTAGLIIYSISVLLTVGLYAARNNRGVSIFVIILLLPIALLSLPYTTPTFSILINSGWLESRIVFIVLLALSLIYPTIRIFILDRNRFSWSSLFFFIILTPIISINIGYTMNFYPEIIDTAKLGGYRYYIVTGINWDFHTLDWFYKCHYSRLGCHHLYSSYAIARPELMIDEINNEVSLLDFSGLVVTDRKNPVYYTGTSGQLGDCLYVLSYDFFEDDDCEEFFCRTYVYVLNSCNLDYKGCKPLPIQYTSPFDITPFWEANETKQEISLYDDYDNGTIIFTYGEQPRCYAEGCEILDKIQR